MMILSKLLVLSSLSLAAVSARKSPKQKSSKGGSSDCDFPMYITEPSETDTAVPNEDEAALYVWEANRLCAGHIDPFDGDECTEVGSASGVCTVLVTGDTCDSVDTWNMFNEDGESIGTLTSRGIAYIPGDAIVLGGTGCFENAGGTIGSVVSGDDDEWWQYDLSNVQLA
mmetsp:Transcript_3940/g.3311  ORF Transcript_3940/g.3311 Transcript_3940/m.3311 type:complete len:170 (-) Transcript_3940:209-718(-)|eukprot:CAMPEP_0194212176 /NCGR_PEP_ID=MMETSP0156-20130528/11891_1 /TAXON_ID=33649 /ORGANISM="Thalassionema nitzschioides, Strain L26-B" /LENGTH=169 /DNA_ID=CAMNT_0038939941 /DNA_START=26 /DNA_END=535 /DNA_ORIENTATION=+